MSSVGRRTFLACGAAAGLGWALRSVAAQAPQKKSAALRKEAALPPAMEAAIGRGLDYLAKRQTESGAFGSGGYGFNVAVVGLAGMAFMAAGSTPDRGPHGRHVTRCLTYILQAAQDSGFIVVAGTQSHGPMYGHGFATLFLAEAYGMARDPRVREALVKAVKLIVETQNTEGGWRYTPQTNEADLSVTICQVMALRAARNAGIFVPNETIDKCTEYVKRCQNPDGGFMYMLPGGPSRFPRSAAGVVALYSAGIYEGDEIERGLKYLLDYLATDDASRESHYYYGHYYAIQAMWHAGGSYWEPWYEAISKSLLASQREDGSWFDSICPEYGTAMACLILQMPNNYLPIFQR